MRLHGRVCTKAHRRAYRGRTRAKDIYGAGSTGGALLRKIGVKEKIRPLPEEMSNAIGRAFFGGRFENSRVGPVRESLWNYDISSAYPYQMTFLPCLEHGQWRRTEDRADLNGSSHALVRYGFSSLGPKVEDVSWGPFPYRFGEGSEEEGSICFPHRSPGGWVYREEYLAGEALFGHVHMIEAWIYETECDCKVFEKIPFYYLYRTLVGKDTGPGITVKLGINSGYGKIAQSIGNALFNCWLWAGIITSGCRGQLLRLMACYSDLRNILAVATDGICGRERIGARRIPKPFDTGTAFHLLSLDDLRPGPVSNKKPLGGWEEDGESNKKGIFLARPGVNFPLYPNGDEIKKIKGRGVGKGVILKNHDRILHAWNLGQGTIPVRVANVKRFCGMKTSISRSGKPGEYRYSRADGSMQFGVERPHYGQWTHFRVVEMDFIRCRSGARCGETGVDRAGD